MEANEHMVCPSKFACLDVTATHRHIYASHWVVEVTVPSQRYRYRLSLQDKNKSIAAKFIVALLKENPDHCTYSTHKILGGVLFRPFMSRLGYRGSITLNAK